MPELWQHNVTLEGKTSRGVSILLRPMTEGDWHVLTRWNSDPEVLYFSEGDNVNSYTLEEVQDIYRSVSQNAFCFIIEIGGKPVGECWLQKMNLERIFQKYPHLDCRRIDIMIGEKGYWGRGIGTEAIRLLTEFGFGVESADMIFGCCIWVYNVRSMRAFQNSGYELFSKIKQNPGSKADYTCDLILTREKFFEHCSRSIF